MPTFVTNCLQAQPGRGAQGQLYLVPNVCNALAAGPARQLPIFPNPIQRRSVSDCQKSLAEFAASAAKKFQIVLDRGVYVGENTSQAASVEFVRLWRTNYARSRLQNWRKSPKGFFDKLQRRSVFQEIFYVQTIHLFPRAQA